MTPQERKLLNDLKRDMDKVKNYTTNLGGSLEFRTLVKKYVLGTGGVLEIGGSLKHTGTTVGFFGVTPVTRQGSIANPTGGATTDAEARTAIDSILSVLDNYGLTS